MCGIFGAIMHSDKPLAPRFQKRFAVFMNTLGVTAADRGVDATGLARVLRNGAVDIYKDVASSYHFVRRDAWRDMVALAANGEAMVLLGHTRRKSHGGNTRANAHPFTFETEHGILVGAHNGVISNYLKFGPKNEVLEVDSANLFYSFAATPREGWVELLERAEGNFALAMARNGEAYLARNSGSPTVSALVPAFNARVYASTAHMLYCAAAMAGVTMRQLHNTAPGKLYRFVQGRRRPLSYTFVEAKPEETAKAVANHHTGGAEDNKGRKLLAPPQRATNAHRSTSYGMCTKCYAVVDVNLLTGSARSKVCVECAQRVAPQPDAATEQDAFSFEGCNAD